MLNQKITNVSRYITFSPDGITISNKPYVKKIATLPERYIINDGATILFWSDGTKTIVKRSKEDEYNKILGFLWAYFQKTSGLSKSKANDYLKGIVDYKDIETINMLNNGNLIPSALKLADDVANKLRKISFNLNRGAANDKNS